MKRLAIKLAFLLLAPTLVLVLGVVLVSPQWYERAELDAVKGHIDYLFIGSSRVAAAIDIPSFSAIMSEHVGVPVHTLNVGQGYSTPIEHYLGLRRLFKIAPDHMKGCVVFLEAPGRTLDLGGWNGQWVNAECPELILNVMSVRDLPFLWHSHATLDTKLSITAHLFTRPKVLLLSTCERIRKRIRARVEQRALKVFTLDRGSVGASTGADLSTHGGIRSDVETVQRARELAVSRTEQSLECQRVCNDWASPVYEALRQLVEEHGGRVVLYDIPQSSFFSRLEHTNIGKANQESFQRQIGRMHTVVLSPSFSFTDNDFPDLWHLRKSEAAEFTEAVARAYIQELPIKQAPAGNGAVDD